MSDRTKIAWTDASWNPIRAATRPTSLFPDEKTGWACTKVSAGCTHCYSESLNKRLGTGLPYTVGALEEVELFLDEETLHLPLRWRKPRRVFVCSMTDLFHERVPDAWIDRVFAVMVDARHHTYQILTKRPERMRAYMADPETPRRIAGWFKGNHRQGISGQQLSTWPPEFVQLGVSVEDQESADARVPMLINTPAAVRFISAEPLLGPVDLDGLWGYPGSADGEALAAWPIQWVILGGESGPSARPCDLAWIRSLLAQAKAAGCPVFVKQLGAVPVGNAVLYEASWPAHVRLAWSDDGMATYRVRLRHRAGADPSEWPADLRVQEWPR